MEFLDKGKEVFVDEADLGLYQSYKWRPHFNGRRWYLVRHTTIGGRGGRDVTILFHREVMDCPEGMVVDHINGNGLDNRRANMRICTYAQNQANRGPNVNNHLGCKGIRKKPNRKKCWCASIDYDGKTKTGYSYTLEGAKKIYNEIAKDVFGDFAYQYEVVND